MPSRLTRSLAFRSAALFRQLLKFTPSSPVAKPCAADLHVITMSGRHHTDMCAQMLLSLGAAWSELPTVHILPDARSSVADLQCVRRAYRGPIEIVAWDEIRQHHSDRGREELLQFAEVDPFGRKLAFSLASADLRRTLWVDNDILFFRDVVPTLRADYGPDPFMAAARDATFDRPQPFFSYAPQMARQFLGHLPSVPAINAGIHLVSGPVYEALHLAEAVRFANDTGEHDYVTEQTIVAIAALRSRGILWDEPLMHMDHDDIYTLGPTFPGKPWHGRHYTGNVRHLFWRDALYLALKRLGNRLRSGAAVPA